jgi:hypothetical protein
MSRPARFGWAFPDFHARPSAEAGAGCLKTWNGWATHSRLRPLIEAARTVQRHCDGRLRRCNSKIADSPIEGSNSRVPAAKAGACGYRSSRTLKRMVYLLAGKLDLALPARDRFYRRSMANNRAAISPGGTAPSRC